MAQWEAEQREVAASNRLDNQMLASDRERALRVGRDERKRLDDERLELAVERSRLDAVRVAHELAVDRAALEEIARSRLHAERSVEARGEPAIPEERTDPTIAIVVPVEHNDLEWLSDLPGDVREIFLHIATHGQINEPEIIRILGDARQSRSFSRRFDSLVVRVPFRIRIDTHGTFKAYVRDDG